MVVRNAGSTIQLIAIAPHTKRFRSLSYKTFSAFQQTSLFSTAVGLREISLTQLDSPTPKNPAWCKNQEHISYRRPVIANLLLKFTNFRCRGNRGWSETNITYTVKFADPEKPVIGARIRNICEKMWNIN